MGRAISRTPISEVVSYLMDLYERHVPVLHTTSTQYHYYCQFTYMTRYLMTIDSEMQREIFSISKRSLNYFLTIAILDLVGVGDEPATTIYIYAT